MIILIVNYVVLTMLFVFDRKYKCVYIYVYFRFYFTIDLFVTSMYFMRTSCSGQIKSAGSTFEIAGFGVLHVRK